MIFIECLGEFGSIIKGISFLEDRIQGLFTFTPGVVNARIRAAKLVPVGILCPVTIFSNWSIVRDVIPTPEPTAMAKGTWARKISSLFMSFSLTFRGLPVRPNRYLPDALIPPACFTDFSGTSNV